MARVRSKRRYVETIPNVARLPLRATRIDVGARVTPLHPPGNSEVSRRHPRGHEGRAGHRRRREPRVSPPTGRSVSFVRWSPTVIGGEYGVFRKAGRAAPGAARSARSPANLESRSVLVVGQRPEMRADRRDSRNARQIAQRLLTGPHPASTRIPESNTLGWTSRPSPAGYREPTLSAMPPSRRPNRRNTSFQTSTVGPRNAGAVLLRRPRSAPRTGAGRPFVGLFCRLTSGVLAVGNDRRPRYQIRGNPP